MLREHLSQAHDAASRRASVIDEQVEWIHRHVLPGKPSRILDLGCGPGLYLQRLTQLGHACSGIDFSPASIAHARQEATRARLPIQYQQQDIRQADFGYGHDLILLIFGEFNVFRPTDAASLLEKAVRALSPGGTLLLEAHTFEAVQRIGRRPARWHSLPAGLFADRPHLWLQESFWNADAQAATTRHYVIDAESSDVACHGETCQAYSDQAYRRLLEETGFSDLHIHPSLTGQAVPSPSDFVVFLARKP